jgi:hypothetical protein
MAEMVLLIVLILLVPQNLIGDVAHLAGHG